MKLEWNGLKVKPKVRRGGADNSRPYFVPDPGLNVNVAFTCIANLDIDLV